MKNIRRILFLGCILLNTTSSMLNAMDYDETLVGILNIVKNINFKDEQKVLESLADYFIKDVIVKKGCPVEETWELKNALIFHKDSVETSIETFKKLPVEVKKITYKAAQATKVALKRVKIDMQNNIKKCKSIIADHEKKQKSLATLTKNKSEKDAATIKKLTKEIEEDDDLYRGAVRSLERIQGDFDDIKFEKIEEWINKITSIAYWNSGSGFFEQFWNLNWSGKALTFVGTPLACYGAYKLYNDYQSAQDEDTVDDVKDSVQNIKKNTETAKVVAPKKLR